MRNQAIADQVYLRKDVRLERDGLGVLTLSLQIKRDGSDFRGSQVLF